MNHDYRRFVIGIGAKSGVCAEAVRAAFAPWFLDPEYQIVVMKKADEPRELCYELRKRHPRVETCIAIQGGDVVIVEAGQRVVKKGEWAYVSPLDGVEYIQFVSPDPMYIHQQHMRHAHGMPTENALAQQRPPANVLLGTLISEDGPIAPGFQYAM